MSVFVKICGLTQPDNVEAVCALGPDAIGFVFWPRSKRFVTPEQAAGLARHVPEGIRKVGVFVDRPGDEIRRIADAVALDVIQLPADHPDLAGLAGFRAIWGSIQAVGEPLPDSAVYPVDAFILDRYSAESPGGTGEACDWSLAARFVENSRQSVVLAGGLRPDNVADALASVRPWGVDTSTGVESSPGVKDPANVKEFIKQCRS